MWNMMMKPGLPLRMDWLSLVPVIRIHRDQNDPFGVPAPMLVDHPERMTRR